MKFLFDAVLEQIKAVVTVVSKTLPESLVQIVFITHCHLVEKLQKTGNLNRI